MRAIRRLARAFPAQSLAERMEKIRGISSGEISSASVRTVPTIEFANRIMRAQASRSPRTAEDKVAEARIKREAEEAQETVQERKRKRRDGLDREYRGGQDRSE